MCVKKVKKTYSAYLYHVEAADLAAKGNIYQFAWHCSDYSALVKSIIFVYT